MKGLFILVSKKKINIGFIGFGEAAFEMSMGFKSEGLHVNFYDVLQDHPKYIDTFREKAIKSEAKIMTNTKRLAIQSDIIVSAVTSDTCIEAVNSIKPYLTENHYYLDINSVSPINKKKIFERVRSKNSKFIEAAVLGTIPGKQHKVPMLICGNSAKDFFELMTPYNMDLTIIEGEIGTATTIKMLRSVFMKGMAALFIETLVAAYKENVLDLVYSSIKETFENKSFDRLTKRLICGTVIHARRRKHEMDEVIDTLKTTGNKYQMSEGTREVLDWIDSLDLRAYFGGEIPLQYIEALEAISKKKN